MRLPAFVDEVFLPRNRPKLLWGIWAGYAVTIGFAALLAFGAALRLLELSGLAIALIAIKLATNTASLVALRTERLVIAASGANLIADVLGMTGAIYLTGGPLSPLVAVYAIEITVIALLTNLGVTVQAALLMLGAYAAMSIALYVGALPALPPPGGGQALSLGYLAADLALTAFVLGVPTYFAGRILAELRANQRALEAKNAALIEAGRSKSQFMANITHELRTPIHGICGLSDLVTTGVYGPTTEAQREAQQGIKTSALGLLKLIDDLLELARADAGRSSPIVERVDAIEIARAVFDAVRWMQGTKRIELALREPASCPPIDTDPRKLRQILLNLVANAVKFTPEGGHVVLRVQSDARAVRFEVQDDGPGIDPRELPRLFTPFEQGDASPEREFGGVGLGLALVARLCEVLGATVEVESERGRGALFRVTLLR